MEAIGLMPSDGKPDGKKYGFKMLHHVMEGSLFDKASATLLEHGWKLTWLDRIAEDFDPALMTDEDCPEEELEEELEEDESNDGEVPQESDAPAPDSEASPTSGEASESGETELPSPSSASAPDTGAPAPPPPSLTRPKGVSRSTVTSVARKSATAFNQRPAMRLDKAALIPRVVKKSGLRHKFTCPKCPAKAWGKPELKLVCGECQQVMPGKPSDEKAGEGE